MPTKKKMVNNYAFCAKQFSFSVSPPLRIELAQKQKMQFTKGLVRVTPQSLFTNISKGGGEEMGQQISVGSEKINKIKYFVLFLSNHGLNLVIEDKDKGATDGTQSIGTRTFEEGGQSLVFQNLREAVLSSFVCPFLLGFL